MSAHLKTPTIRTASETGLTDRIDAWLPQIQCGRCGYPSCREYAQAVAMNGTDIDRCTPGGAVTLQALSSVTGRSSGNPNPTVDAGAGRQLARIDELRCIGCRKCLNVCPVDAILGARKQMHTVLASLCNGCGLCLPPCPVDCIRLMPVTPGVCAPWPEYDRAEVERWRQRSNARAARLKWRVRPPGPTGGRDDMRREIRAAVQRVRARKKSARPGRPTR